MIASSTQNALYQECTLGNAVADAMILYTGADIAIVNGGMLKGNLLHGDVTEQDIAESITDAPLALAQVSAKQLFDILEAALSYVVIDDGRQYVPDKSENAAFPQISGFRISYDPSAPYGERLARLTVNNEPLDKNDTETTFTLVSTVAFLEGQFGTPPVEDFTLTGDTLHSVFISYIKDGMDDIYALPENRVNAMGVNKSQESSRRYMIFTAIAILIIFYVLGMRIRKRRPSYEIEDITDSTESEENK